MKLNKFLVVFPFYFVILPMFAMEPEPVEKRKAPTEVFEPHKRIRFEHLRTLPNLPRDLKLSIILELIRQSPNLLEAVKSIKNLMRTNKAFYSLINSEDINNAIIHELAVRFTHGDSIRAAEALKTNAALIWRSLNFPESIQIRIKQFLQDHNLDTLDKIIQAIKTYMNLNPLVKRALETDPLIIWTIKQIIKDEEASESASSIAAKMYPKLNFSNLVKQWIAYADKQISKKNEIVNALINENIESLQKLIDEGIDIGDLVFIEKPLIHFAGTQTLPWLIQKGADLNERDEAGDTIIHSFIFIGDFFDNEKLALLEQLLKAGANPNIEDSRGFTALFLAKQAHQRANDPLQKKYFHTMIELLRKYGALE